MLSPGEKVGSTNSLLFVEWTTRKKKKKKTAKGKATHWEMDCSAHTMRDRNEHVANDGFFKKHIHIYTQAPIRKGNQHVTSTRPQKFKIGFTGCHPSKIFLCSMSFFSPSLHLFLFFFFFEAREWKK